jgi:hypothetical protein
MQIRRNSSPLRGNTTTNVPSHQRSDRAFLIMNFRPEPIPGTTEPTPDLKSIEIVASAGERSTEANCQTKIKATFSRKRPRMMIPEPESNLLETCSEKIYPRVPTTDENSHNFQSVALRR